MWRGAAAKWLKKHDMFGMKVGLMYQGQPVHKTLVGTFVSILLWIYMIIFGASSFIVVWRSDTASINTSYLKFDIDNPAEGFVPHESGFNFGFGFSE